MPSIPFTLPSEQQKALADFTIDDVRSLIGNHPTEQLMTDDQLYVLITDMKADGVTVVGHLGAEAVDGWLRLFGHWVD
jgi:hypothetical protein